MKIVIPGGGGYIGGCLSRRLLELGHDVVTWSRSNSKTVDLENYSAFNYQDLSQQAVISDDTDAVVYLAGISAPQALEQTQQMFSVNTFQALNLFRNFTSPGNQHFIYASSSHVTTLLTGDLLTNSTSQESVQLYATSKLTAETVLTQLNSDIRKNLVILRLANCFGVPDLELGSDTPGVINDLCRQAVQTQVIKLRSDASIRRTFITVTSCVEKIVDELVTKRNSATTITTQVDSFELTLQQAALLSKYFCEIIVGKPTSIEIQGRTIVSDDESIAVLLNAIPKDFSIEIENLIRHYVKHKS